MAAPRLPSTTTRHCRKKLMCRGPPFVEGIVFISLCLPLLQIICPLCAMIPVKTSTLQPRPEPRSAASSKQHPRHGTQTPQVQGSRCLSDMPIFALLLRGLKILCHPTKSTLHLRAACPPAAHTKAPQCSTWPSTCSWDPAPCQHLGTSTALAHPSAARLWVPASLVWLQMKPRLVKHSRVGCRGNLAIEVPTPLLAACTLQ